MIINLLYVEPGSSSYLLQVIVAAVLGAAFWIKMSWLRIKAFFTGKKIERTDKARHRKKS